MAKHYMLYYKKGTGTFIVTEPKPWANENRNKFRNHSFSNNSTKPTTAEIEKYLINKHGFVKSTFNNRIIHFIYNLDPNINL